MATATCSSILRATPWPSQILSTSPSLRKGNTRSSYRPIVMEFHLRPLPFEMDALEPYMSKQTLEFHWGKHHRTYVDNLNKQIKGTELEGMQLDELLKHGYNNGNPTAYFNNAGQAWNHDFFWESIKPGGGKKPTGEVLHLIERDFGSFEAFVDEFKQAAATQFGSGWAWLVGMPTDPLVENKFGKLAIEKTPNALNPLILGHVPLLTIDVWEHAYYLDYQNRRPDYISTVINELISWEAVTARLERAKATINFYDVVVPDDQYKYK
uniref:superoxide dismutase n=1 Tax=Ceratopteris thalictroides TaxID=29596 RepID=E5LFP9_9MONI|nr:iron-superoxide dismutase [Ceratopteris thalictroides]